MAVNGDRPAPLDVTRTGPAAAWADVAALAAEGIRLVDERTPVVLVLVDGRVPPARGDVELVEAVSGATGRCAVGLDLDDGDGASAAWRDAVPADVAVGPPDAAMARTLRLLAAGPARPATPTPGQRRRSVLAGQLAADRDGRAREAEKHRRERAAAVPHAIADALESIARPDVPDGPGALDESVGRAAGALARELDLPRAPGVPAAPPVPAARRLPEIGAALLMFGASFGVGGLLGGPLRWAGLPTWAVGLATGVVGLALGMTVVIGGRGRRKAGERAAWAAAHLARVRRAWGKEVADMLRAEARTPPDGWRARHLAAALRAETGERTGTWKE